VVKLFALIPARRDRTLEQFHEHWRTRHRKLALKLDSMRTYGTSRPGASDEEFASWWGEAHAGALASAFASADRVTQSAVIAETRRVDVACDGIAELWWREHRVLLEAWPQAWDGYSAAVQSHLEISEARRFVSRDLWVIGCASESRQARVDIS
jgi:hypothetical protein